MDEPISDPIGQAAQPTTSPLDTLGNPAQPAAPSMTPDQIDRTARMATISNAPLTDVLTNYQTMTAMNKKIIASSGDMSVRLEAATQQQNEQVTSLAKLAVQPPRYDPTGELQRGASMAMAGVVNEDITRRAEYALEQRTLQRLRDTAQLDPTQAAVIYNNIQHPGAEAVLDDINTKKMIIAREVEKAQGTVENQGWIKNAVDFASSLIDPFAASSMGGNFQDPTVVKHWYDWVLGGERQRSEASNLWSLEPADFAKAIRENVIPNIQKNATLLGYTDHSKELNLLTGLQNTKPVWETNVGQAANVAMTVLPFLKIGKATDVGYALVRSGNRAAAAENLAGATIQSVREGVAAASDASGLSQENIIDGIRPQVVNDGIPTSSVNVSGNALDAIDRANLLTQNLNVSSSGRATAAEYQAHFDNIEKLFSTQTGRPIKDWKINDVNLPDGSKTFQAEYYVGKTKGDGFANPGQATRWAEGQGMGTVEPIQDDSGQWFIKVNRDIPEVNGAYKIQLNPGLQKTGIAGRLMLGARQIGDDMLGAWERVAGNTKAKLIKSFVDEYSDALRSIPKGEKDTLSAVLAWGEHQGTWMTDDELGTLYQSRFGRSPTDTERTGYRVMQDINDVEYGMRNSVEYKTRVLKGYETASFEHPLIPGNVDRENALISREPNTPPLGRIYDTTTDTHLATVSPEELRAMGGDGKVLVSLERPKTLADNTTIKHFIVDKKGLTAEPLRADQVPYRAGGHRMYDAGNYFVKQTVHGIQPDTGETFLKNPATYSTGTKAEMTKWADTMEQARQMFKAGVRDPERFTEHLAGLGYMDGPTFIKAMEEGTFQRETAFTTLYDRELPHEYLETPHTSDFVDRDETGLSGWLRTNGRMYYSAKGAPLLDWKGNLAKTLDPFEVANTALMNVANLTSWSDYKISAVSRWVDTYGKYLNLDALPKGASDYTVFSDAKLNSNVNRMPMGAGEQIKQAMEAQRDIIRRNIGWQSDWDAQVKQYSQRLANYIMGNDPESMRHAIGQASTRWWNDVNPLRSMRGLAFDLKMGLFNVAHFPMRIQTMLASMALAGPERAGMALSNFIPMRLYLTKSGTEHMLDELVNRGVHTWAGFTDPKEYKMMMREGKTSGFFDVGNTHQMINAYGPDAAAGGFRNAWDKFSKAGRFALVEGENWNRIMGWQHAWQEVSKESGLKVGSRDMLNQVALKADDYSLNMSAQSAAAWQHGPMSIPTQFWSYQARVTEALLGRNFTPQQRLRLLLAQTFFYGSAGTPLAYGVSQVVKGVTGQTSPDPTKKPLDTMLGAMDRGAFDEMIYHTTGGDVMVGERYGTGTFMVDMVKELFGMSAYGEKSWADTMGGATYSIMKDTSKVGFQTIKAMIDYTTAESGAQDYPLVRDDVIRLLNNSSAFSYTMKGMLAYRYHIMTTNAGAITASSLPNGDSFFIGMGIQPGETDQVSAMQSYLSHRKQTVLEASKFIQTLRQEYVNEPDRRSEIISEINVFTRLLPEDIRVSALKHAQTQLTPDMLSNVNKQMARDRALAEEVKRYGQPDE